MPLMLTQRLFAKVNDLACLRIDDEFVVAIIFPIFNLFAMIPSACFNGKVITCL